VSPKIFDTFFSNFFPKNFQKFFKDSTRRARARTAAASCSSNQQQPAASSLFKKQQQPAAARSQQQQPAAASMGMAAAWLLHGHAAWAWLMRGMLPLQNRDAWCMACCCFKTGMHGAWTMVQHVASRMFESSKFAAV
jgi:hypothetical protein